MIKVSVIIPTVNRAKYLRNTLMSIIKQSLPRDMYEIIVVDNASTDNTREIVESLNLKSDHQIYYVYESRIGLHHGRHTGARKARGEILVYIDDDVIVSFGWLKAIVEPFLNDPQVACVGGKVIAKWECEPPQWLSQFHSGYLSLLDLGEEAKELKWPEGVHGCNMAMRRSVLYEVGGFNPDAIGDRRLIWMRGDGETGLHQKIYDAGYKVVYEPKSWVYHQIPVSRLKPEYFYWRAFIQGISDSYSRVRAICTNKLLLHRLLSHALHCFLQASRCYLSSFRYPDRQIRLKADTWYWYGRGRHQLHTALSPKLGRHVLRETYM